MNQSSPMCRSCGQTDLKLVLSLGKTPLANALLTAEQLERSESTFPLDLAFCPHCSLVQITETVPPDRLFSDYLYFSSFSETALENAKEIGDRLAKSQALDASSLVVEIASNDGYLLQHYQKQCIPVLGIEPAANIARVAQEERGIPTLCEFFGNSLAERLSRAGKKADIIHANNVLAHVPDLNGFVSGIYLLLKDEGIAVIEAPYAKDMVDGCEFDTIYHEHLCYFSLSALDKLFQRHHLAIIDVEQIPIHGGSLRVFVSKKGEKSPAVQKLLAAESELGVNKLDYYQDFGSKVEDLRQKLLTLLNELKGRGKRIAAYGASAKGSTLLNYFGVGRETLEFVCDRSTYKQGKYTPGTHLPIYPPEKLLENLPDYVLLLTWNFADEILKQQAEYRQRGGQFIIPIPELKVI